jgi:hypothetical protein
VTKDEKAYQDRVRELGCIICERPASIHHIRDGIGKGQKASEYDVLPLCPDHHQHGGYGVAFHAGKRVWQEVFGTERDLLEEVQRRLSGDY